MAELLPVDATKITCEVYASLAPQAEAALAALGVDSALQHSRRALVLRERVALPFLPPATRLEQDPAEVFEIYLPRAAARSVLLAWARALQLFTPGRGTIYAEEVQLLSAPGLELGNAQLGAEGSEGPGERLAPLALINCVVQRGRGNDLARAALEIGSNVPSINFGTGTGVRDRLGLLRIAIPADKEVLSLLVDAHEQQEILDTLIEAARLDQPGRGFIAAYAVPFGVANPRAFRGRQRHSATMDQIIAAIDHLKAGTDWRRRSGGVAQPSQRRYLRDLVNVTLSCNEGNSAQLLDTAMRAGAGGATLSRTRLVSPSGKTLAAFPGRELIDLGLAPDKVAGLLRALHEAGAFAAEVACAVETKALPLAFTYMAPA